MPHGIKIVSVNIECNRHYERLFPFIADEKPDVICLQEVLEQDIPQISKTFALVGQLAPMERLTEARFSAQGLHGQVFGIALFTRFPATFQTKYYCGAPETIPWQKPNNQGVNEMLLIAEFEHDGKPYRIGTTHFTWTPDGEASDAQREDMSTLLTILSGFPDMVFCGDFNAPRGGEIWEKLAARYTDNIPATYRSSLDRALHRAGHLEHVVDGLFSTPEYRVSDVRLVEGVSDHKAVVGYVERIG